jgi:SAM-dependent methyltransferase
MVDPVEFYDLRECGGPGTLLDGDVEFYLAQAQKTGGPILDLACGTGRVALPRERAGFTVTGVERAPGMLAVARAKQRAAGLATLKFLQGNMARFHLGRRFRLAIMAYRAFQHLLTPNEQCSCLQCVRRHVPRQGRLIVHLFDPRLEHCVPNEPAYNGKRAPVHDLATQQDVLVEVTDRRVDPLSQTFSETWLWTVMQGAFVVRTCEDVLQLRWTYRYEMGYLLKLAGFRVLAEYSDFKGSPPLDGAEQVWVAEAV